MTSTKTQEDVYICPSFNSYSSDRLAEIAERVAVETPNDAAGDEDFEFSLVREDSEVSTKLFPVFNRDLLLRNDGAAELSTSGGGGGDAVLDSSAAVPLSKLFIDSDHERGYDCNDPPSCSSSEADELESIPADTYCVWRPKTADPPRCRKSKSTGSASKRWKFIDLMRRSKSDGKDSFVFLSSAPNHREAEKRTKSIRADSKKPNGKSAFASASASASASGGGVQPPSAHEAFYVRNRAMKEGERKKSYLPYRQDLVGLFGNVNGLPRSFPHF